MLDSYDYTNKLYQASLSTGITKEQAKLIAAAGINLQGIIKIYDKK